MTMPERVRQILAAPWIPHPVPKGGLREVHSPFTSETPPRILTIVEDEDGQTFVLASEPHAETVRESWKVLL